MKRKIYNQLLAWKEGKDRKPLMLLGARQVGKTWIMQHFGENEYKKVAYINCDDEPRMKQLFELDYNIERILITIQAITGVRVTPGDTLIILDEIQEIPRGLHSLKYFCEKVPEFHIMVAGSPLPSNMLCSNCWCWESSRIIGAMPRLLPRSTLLCNTTIVWCRLRLRRRRMCALARWHNL